MSMFNRINKLWKKTIGKLFTYIGLVIAIAGINWLIFELMAIGIFTIIVGCLMHELNENE